MSRQHLMELCDDLQRELAEGGVDSETQESLNRLLLAIRENLERPPGEETTRLALEADHLAQGLDPTAVPGASLLGELARKLSAMGI